MPRTVRRCARALAAALLAGGLLALLAPAASADPKIPFSQDVYARTHLAKSGMDITVPPGQFEGFPGHYSDHCTHDCHQIVVTTGGKSTRGSSGRFSAAASSPSDPPLR